MFKTHPSHLMHYCGDETCGYCNIGVSFCENCSAYHEEAKTTVCFFSIIDCASEWCMMENWWKWVLSKYKTTGQFQFEDADESNETFKRLTNNAERKVIIDMSVSFRPLLYHLMP